LTLDAVNNFAVTSIVNPFNQAVTFSVIAGTGTKVEAELLNMFGEIVKRKSSMVPSGVSMLSLTSLGSLPAGTYILRIRIDDRIISRKVLKTNVF
jgi:hypothetical protein